MAEELDQSKDASSAAGQRAPDDFFDVISHAQETLAKMRDRAWRACWAASDTIGDASDPLSFHAEFP